MVAYELGGYIFETLLAENIEHQGPAEKKDFQNSFVKEVIRDYMQTLVALGGGTKLYVYAGFEV